jgi:hypothetical protein
MKQIIPKEGGGRTCFSDKGSPQGYALGRRTDFQSVFSLPDLQAYKEG